MPNVGISNFIKQTLLDIRKTQIDSNPKTLGNFNIPLLPIDKPSKPKN
jgi:hypothetical protein